MKPSVADQPCTYLALGDSYTIGESIGASQRWSSQLVEKLQKQGIDISGPDIIAQTGWTTSELATAIEKSGNRKRYSLVSLLIGVNDQYRGEDINKFRDEFRSLLDTAVDFAQGMASRVFVLSIPDWGVTPYAASRDRDRVALEIDKFNAVVSDECNSKGIRYLDITPISRTAFNNPSMIASDGLHFSGKMYEKWADEAVPVVKAILRMKE